MENPRIDRLGHNHDYWKTSVIHERSHKKKLRDPSENTRPSYHSGMDYWKMTRVTLEIANEEYARRMKGEKYEDEERVR